MERLHFYDECVEQSLSVCTPSNIKVCEFESLIRGQDKFLSNTECALANSFLFVLFFEGINLER